MLKKLLSDPKALWNITEEEKAFLRATGSKDKEVAMAAQKAFALEFGNVIQEGIFSGDIISGIFELNPVDPEGVIEYPIDFVVPGSEHEFNAYTMPDLARIPERQVISDRVLVSTYDVATSIDWGLKYARQARWDVVGRALNSMMAGYQKKMNDDGWHTILAAAVNRGIYVYDANAASGQFTLRLISLMKTVMRRRGGGNTASPRRFKLTDLFISPEALEDIRNWTDTQIDEVTKREILTSEDGKISRVYGVNLHDMDEFGENAEYQKYAVDVLGASLVSGDKELCVGMDLTHPGTFVMPVSQELEVFEDESMHRRGKMGYYARSEVGFGVLDGRCIIFGSF